MAKDKTIIRTRKNRENPYVMIDKTGVEDPRLSLKAKGLLATLLAKPDDWKIYITQLASTCKDGVDSVKSALKELREFGYVTMERIRDEKGKITHSEWIVYEQPIYDEKIELKPRRDKKIKQVVSQDESISGFSTNGETTNGKPTDGKSHTTNKQVLLNNDLTNNDLTNNNNKRNKTGSDTSPHNEALSPIMKKDVVVDLLSKHDIDISPKTLIKWSGLADEKTILAAIEDAISNPKVKNVVGYVTRMLEQGYTPPVPGSVKLPEWIVKKIEDAEKEPTPPTPVQQQEILDLLFQLGEITKEEYAQKSKELEQR